MHYDKKNITYDYERIG
jgi:hypothetical protein